MKRKYKATKSLQEMLLHPAGRVGITIGLAVGFIATIMGVTSKALLFAGFCRLLAQRITQHKDNI